jgi:hypothetical protein
MSFRKSSFSLISVFFITVSLSACSGGSKSSGTLKPSDIIASVSCDAWTETIANLGETDCLISIENKSSASGVIYIAWDWKDGDKGCGIGGSMTNLNIGPNESGTKKVASSMMCSPSYNYAVPTNIEVIVRPK